MGSSTYYPRAGFLCLRPCGWWRGVKKSKEFSPCPEKDFEDISRSKSIDETKITIYKKSIDMTSLTVRALANWKVCHMTRISIITKCVIHWIITTVVRQVDSDHGPFGGFRYECNWNVKMHFSKNGLAQWNTPALKLSVLTEIYRTARDHNRNCFGVGFFDPRPTFTTVHLQGETFSVLHFVQINHSEEDHHLFRWASSFPMPDQNL